MNFLIRVISAIRGSFFSKNHVHALHFEWSKKTQATLPDSLCVADSQEMARITSKVSVSEAAFRFSASSVAGKGTSQ
jgi:hypothetical protein